MDSIKPSDEVLRCPAPRCGSKHYLVSAKVRTDVRRGGKHLTFESGNVCQCLRCGHVFATTDEGVVDMPQPGRVAYQNSTELPKLPDPPTRVEQWSPKQRQSGV